MKTSDDFDRNRTSEVCNILEMMTVDETVRCLHGRKVAFIGDSILRDMFVELIRLKHPEIEPSIPGDRRYAVPTVPGFVTEGSTFIKGQQKRKRVYSAIFKANDRGGSRGQVDFYSFQSTTFVKQLGALTLLKTADYTDVVMSNSAWDLGIHYRSFALYERDLKSQILSASKTTRPRGGKVVFVGLHHIDTARCRSPICTVCNHNYAQRSLRQIQANVVPRIEGATLVDQFTTSVDAYACGHISADGLHPDSYTSSHMMQNILRAICPRHSDTQPLRNENCSKVDDDQGRHSCKSQRYVGRYNVGSHRLSFVRAMEDVKNEVPRFRELDPHARCWIDDPPPAKES